LIRILIGGAPGQVLEVEIGVGVEVLRVGVNRIAVFVAGIGVRLAARIVCVADGRGELMMTGSLVGVLAGTLAILLSGKSAWSNKITITDNMLTPVRKKGRPDLFRAV